MYEKLIDDNHCGMGIRHDYKKLVVEKPITEKDIAYFSGVIESAMNGGQYGYDTFPDEGGIDIAKVLLEEVKRLRAANT